MGYNGPPTYESPWDRTRRIFESAREQHETPPHCITHARSLHLLRCTEPVRRVQVLRRAGRPGC